MQNCDFTHRAISPLFDNIGIQCVIPKLVAFTVSQSIFPILKLGFFFVDTKRSGILELDNKNKVVAFLEKPDPSTTSSRWAVSDWTDLLQACTTVDGMVLPYTYATQTQL